MVSVEQAHAQSTSLGKRRQASEAERVIAWIETYCHIPEGKFVGHPVRLRPWQKDEIRKIYDNPHGTRRAIISWGRKNAKTTFAAFLLLVHLVGPKARPNSQLFSTAQSRDQAAVLFKAAARIVRMSSRLMSVVRVREHAKELVCRDLGTRYRALTAEVATAYGLSPVFLVHDELGQVRGPRSELYDAMETATGAHENPLSIIISTQAPTDADLLSVLIDDALAGNDPRTVVSLHTADVDADPFADATIKQANPAFGDFLSAKEVRSMALDAQRMPSREAQYRNLVLNQRVESANNFLSPGIWKACAGVLKDITSVPVYAGLDLSATNDLTALVLIGKVDGKWQVYPTFWLPSDGLREKARTDRVPYDMWQKQGLLETTPGAAIRYEHIAAYLLKLCKRYNIKKIGFDRWNMKHLKPWLEDAGFNEMMIEELFVEFGQGTQSMSPALRDLEAEVVDGRLQHGDHPVMNMCVANAVVEGRPGDKVDEANRKLSKKRSRGRIDGIVALTMAIGVAPLREPALDIGGMIS